MLPLDSPRWNELNPFYGQPEDVPIVLADWLQSIGFDQEPTIYWDRLFQLFLHQGTITNLAYAVVPWLVEAATVRCSPLAADYLADVAMVEWDRLEFGTYSPRGTPGEEPPGWLADDYHRAIECAGPAAEDLLDTPLEERSRDSLWRLLPALFGNATLAAKRYRGE
jgi:hypothetical protein